MTEWLRLWSESSERFHSIIYASASSAALGQACLTGVSQVDERYAVNGEQ